MCNVSNAPTPRKVAASRSVNNQTKIKAIGFVVFDDTDPYPPSRAAIARRMFTGADAEPIPVPPCWERWQFFSTFEALRAALDAAERAELTRAAFRGLRRNRELAT